MFPSADGVGKYTVFNFKGNSYRLITVIFYPKMLFIRDVLGALCQHYTHRPETFAYALEPIMLWNESV